MADRKPGKVVSTVAYAPTGEIAEIRLLKNPMRFYAQVGEGNAKESFEDKDGDAVSAWALEALKRNAISDWRPVIEVYLPTHSGSSSAEDGDDEGLQFEFRRFYIGRTPKSWREVSWERFNVAEPTKMADAIKELRFKYDQSHYSWQSGESAEFDGSLPYHTYSVDSDDYDWVESARERERMIRHAKRGVLLAYDEATWATICGIAAALRRARERLIDLIERPAGLAALGADAGALLALASDDAGQAKAKLTRS
jgi:hypothetical protein